MTRPEPDLLATLFRLHGRMVYRRCLRILGNAADAEEATQEVFIRVMRSTTDIAARDSVVQWLYRITTNHCLNVVRNRGRRGDLHDDREAELPRPRAETAAPKLLLLRRLLVDADAQQAQAAIYVHLDGLSQREAADLMGVSRRTIGNLLERFTAWAHEQVEGQGRATP